MSAKQQNPVEIFISLLVVFLLGIGLYLLITAFIDKLNSVGSDLSKAIITGGVTVSVAVFSLVIGKLWEQQVQIQQNLREKKIPVYEKQIEIFFSAMFAEKYGDKKLTKEEIAKAFNKFTEKLIIWGSAEVIKAWSDFRLHNWENGKPAEGFLKVEYLMKAIRKDLGNSNSNLSDGDIVKLFINDFTVAIADTPEKLVPDSE